MGAIYISTFVQFASTCDNNNNAVFISLVSLFYLPCLITCLKPFLSLYPSTSRILRSKPTPGKGDRYTLPRVPG